MDKRHNPYVNDRMDQEAMSASQYHGTPLEKISKATLVTTAANQQLHQLEKKKQIFKSKINTNTKIDTGMDRMSLDSPRGVETLFRFQTYEDRQEYQPPDKFESVSFI